MFGSKIKGVSTFVADAVIANPPVGEFQLIVRCTCVLSFLISLIVYPSISNPPTGTHIDVCEALAIPLHIMFPQPWYYGTYSMPHPFSGLSYDEPLSPTNTQAKANSASYHLWEDVMSASLGRKRNKWRVNTLKLPSSKCRVSSACNWLLYRCIDLSISLLSISLTSLNLKSLGITSSATQSYYVRFPLVPCGHQVLCPSPMTGPSNARLWVHLLNSRKEKLKR